ncbi:MAG: ABC transporter permease [Bacillus subtilis]|nr:ABC transporter permease [Bacillus subtilis]
MLKAMVLRNLKLYFRDKASVFFSMLGVLLIILMYVLFLGAMIVGMAEGFSAQVARFFTDSWVMAGVIAATSMTTCLAGFGIMVDDKAKKISMDFESSPIPRSTLVLAYVLASVVIGLVMTTFTLFLGELYIVIFGGEFLSFAALLKVLGLVVLSVSASSAVVFFLVSNVKSPNAFGTLSTLIGTLIGFLTGVYVPIGNLPAVIQTVIKIIPVSHAAAALRQVMMEEAIPLEFVPADIKTFMGIQFEVGGEIMPFWSHLLILFGTFVVFYILSVLIISKRKNKA